MPRVEVEVPCGRVHAAGWCTDGGQCPDDCPGHEVTATATGRSALLLRLGETNARWMTHRGSRNMGKRYHADYLDALAALRQWDDQHTGGDDA